MHRRTRNDGTILDGGNVPASLAAVAAFLDDARLEAAAMPAPAPRPALVAIFEGCDALPVAPPGSARRTPAILRLRPVAALVAAGAVSFGGLAAAGALPGPVQRTSAQLGTHLGLRLPGATPPAPGPATTPTTPTPTPSPTTTGASTATTKPSAPSPARPSGNGPATTTPEGETPLPSTPRRLPLPELPPPIGADGLPLPPDVVPRPTFRH